MIFSPPFPAEVHLNKVRRKRFCKITKYFLFFKTFFCYSYIYINALQNSTSFETS